MNALRTLEQTVLAEARQRHLFFLAALTQGFCYRVQAVALVECYQNRKAINGNHQHCGTEGNCGGGQHPV